MSSNEPQEIKYYWVTNADGKAIYKIRGCFLEVLDGRVLVYNEASAITAVVNLAPGDSILESL